MSKQIEQSRSKMPDIAFGDDRIERFQLSLLKQLLFFYGPEIEFSRLFVKILCGPGSKIIFPEIDIDKVGKVTGMDITFVTSASNDEEAMELMKEFGLPFKTN